MTSLIAPSSKYGIPASSVTWLAAKQSGLAEVPNSAPAFSGPVSRRASAIAWFGSAASPLTSLIGRSSTPPAPLRSSAASSSPR